MLYYFVANHSLFFSLCRLVPVPVVGFSALQQRMKHQEQETAQHAKRLEVILLTIHIFYLKPVKLKRQCLYQKLFYFLSTSPVEYS